jgi:hypothetical protein
MRFAAILEKALAFLRTGGALGAGVSGGMDLEFEWFALREEAGFNGVIISITVIFIGFLRQASDVLLAGQQLLQRRSNAKTSDQTPGKRRPHIHN